MPLDWCSKTLSIAQLDLFRSITAGEFCWRLPLPRSLQWTLRALAAHVDDVPWCQHVPPLHLVLTVSLVLPTDAARSSEATDPSDHAGLATRLRQHDRDARAPIDGQELLGEHICASTTRFEEASRCSGGSEAIGECGVMNRPAEAARPAVRERKGVRHVP